MWRVWIEIWMAIGNSADGRSPSVWRVWIEIMITDQRLNTNAQSPSVWRVWIEMSNERVSRSLWVVTLRVEGVD